MAEIFIDKAASVPIIGKSFTQLRRTQRTRMHQSISTAWPVVLSVAGFDPSAGAGIVADLKTFACAQLLWCRGHHRIDRPEHSGGGIRPPG
jgi:hypothetical protein